MVDVIDYYLKCEGGLLDSELRGFEEMSNTRLCLFFFDAVSLPSVCNTVVVNVVAYMTFTNIDFFPRAIL